MYELRFLDEFVSKKGILKSIANFKANFLEIKLHPHRDHLFRNIEFTDDPLCYSYEELTSDDYYLPLEWKFSKLVFSDLRWKNYHYWSRSTFLEDVLTYINRGSDVSLIVSRLKTHYHSAKEYSSEFPFLLKCMDDLIEFTCYSFPEHFKKDDFKLKAIACTLDDSCIQFLTKLHAFDFGDGKRFTNSSLDHLIRLLTTGINTSGPIVFNIQSKQIALIFQLLSENFFNGSNSSFFSSIESSKLFLSSRGTPFSKKALEKDDLILSRFHDSLKALIQD